MARPPLLLVALALLLVAAAPAATRAQTCSVAGAQRVDCGYVGITQGQCEAKGCCWSPISDPVNNYPWCFYKSASACGAYAVTGTRQTALGFDLTLALQGAGCAVYGPDIALVQVRVEFETADRLHVRITDANNARYEVPEVVFPRPRLDEAARETGYAFSYVASPFGFAVTRKSTGEVLFNTSASAANPAFSNLIFEDQYLELSTQLPSGANIYGLGERVRPLRLSENLAYTMWTADEATPVNQNVYGAHPFYLEMRASGRAHGVLLMNSNGMDVTLRPGSLTYQVIGGVFDFYFFEGPSPAEVLAQYMGLVGRPFLIPLWALGFHQCRYGYKNIDEVREVVRRYREAGIPLETMWIDIDYMDGFRDWTFDPVNYPVAEVAAFIDELHANKQRNVLIVDPAIKNETGYKYYDDGIKRGVFIRDGTTRQPMVGMVWPYYTVFPDFLNPETEAYWTDSLADFRDLVEVDGLWIDMNEAANFCQGNKIETCNYPILAAPERRALKDGGASGAPEQRGSARSKAFDGVFDPNNPPYRINNANSRRDLDVKTTAMDAYHYNGELEYNVHNLYGVTETIQTFNAIAKVIGRRPFVLSRSTFPGSGRYGGHWTGDNFSTWEHLYYTIPGMLQFQLFGVPFTGADICGFIYDTTEELCARWAQLGSFYPFARNHNTISASSQEYYLWDSVAKNARTTLAIRYALINYWYTLFYESSVNGTAVVRPLFFEHPADSTTYNIDRQFYVGSHLLVTPVLNQGATSVRGYFPAGTWYDWYTLQRTAVLSVGEYRDLSAPLDFIPVHIRGGAVLVLQTPAYSLTETLESLYEIVVALDNATNRAAGFVYLDDGESLDTPVSSTSRISYVATANQLKTTGSYGFSARAPVTTIKIAGTSARPTQVTINGVSYTATAESYGFSVRNLQVSMNADFTMVW